MNVVLDDSITSVEYNGTPVDAVEFNGVEVWRDNRDDWSVKEWNVSPSFASGIWTDGVDVYYSYGSTQKVLDKSTSTWNTKTWSGLTSFYAQYIWTDGVDVYYSYGRTQKVLDKSTSTWNEKTWSGLTPSLFYAQYIWTDGVDVYYSNVETQKVLDKSTSTWNTKTWSGLTSFDASGIWTDGTDIYFSYSYKVTGKEYYDTHHYILDKSTSTWSSKTFYGLNNTVFLYGRYFWTDGKDMYCSYSRTSNNTTYAFNYILDKTTSIWNTKTWSGFTPLTGDYIWNDGVHIYYSRASHQYVYRKVLT